MYRVLNNFILVKPDPDEWTHNDPNVNEALKTGKLILPENREALFKKVARTGTIVAWGSSCKHAYKVGLKVWYGQFAGAPVDKEHRVISELECLMTEEYV